MSSLCLVNIIQKRPPKTFLHKLSIPHPLFALLSKRWKEGKPRKTKDKILSCQVSAKQVELWSSGWAQGSGGKGGGTQVAESSREKNWDIEKEGVSTTTAFAILLLKIHSSSLCLIGNTWFWPREYCAGTITPYVQGLPGEVAFGQSVPPWGWLVA